MLAIVAFHDPAQGKVFVEIGPVEAEGGDLDVVKLLLGAQGQTWILRHRETNFNAASHPDEDVPRLVRRSQHAVSQGAHASHQ